MKRQFTKPAHAQNCFKFSYINGKIWQTRIHQSVHCEWWIQDALQQKTNLRRPGSDMNQKTWGIVVMFWDLSLGLTAVGTMIGGKLATVPPVGKRLGCPSIPPSSPCLPCCWNSRSPHSDHPPDPSRLWSSHWSCLVHCCCAGCRGRWSVPPVWRWWSSRSYPRRAAWTAASPCTWNPVFQVSNAGIEDEIRWN